MVTDVYREVLVTTGLSGTVYISIARHSYDKGTLVHRYDKRYTFEKYSPHVTHMCNRLAKAVGNRWILQVTPVTSGGLYFHNTCVREWGE